MKIWYALLLAASPLVAHAQLIPASGPGDVLVNWRPTAAVDSLRLDVNGDGITDIRFTRSYIASGGQSQPTLSYFNAYVGRNSGMEIAIDANEFDSVHRFVAGDQIGPGLLWQSTGGGFLDYTITGNGGTGGRGFFRYNAAGFVVIRRNLGSQMRYWWFYIEPRLASANGNWISYYGGTSVALAAGTPQQESLLQAYPNPATASWQLSVPTAYELYDNQGRQVDSSCGRRAQVVEARGLAAGTYLLVLRGADGAAIRRPLIKE
jgi:hypothetical protein